MKFNVTRKEFLALSAAGVLTALTPFQSDAAANDPTTLAESSVVTPKARLFPLGDIRINGGPFLRNQDTDVDYLLKLEPDRLMAFMRTNVGLPAQGEHYGGWDNGGSFIVGHYLSAVSQMSQSTGDARLAARVDNIVSQMADCQKAGGDGGLYSFKGDIGWFHDLQKGVVHPANTTAWYVTHKTMAGLRDAWFLCGNQQAKQVILAMCDWCIAMTANLNHAQWQEMLGPPNLMGEFGGPNEVLADVYSATGDRKYLICAEKFKHDIIFDPVLAGNVSILDGQHANTEVPKFVGYERTYEVTGDPSWHIASLNFWKAVAQHYTWPNGGAGQWEHFQPINDKNIYQDCGPETCVSYNMLKLTRQLWAQDPSPSYINYYERTLYNSILPTEAPGGGFVYYTTMRPGHYRVFSRPFDAFWCCVGTGMENQAQLGQMTYGYADDRLFVNLFMPSTLTWRSQGMTLTQETNFPETPSTRLKVKLAHPKKLTISVRYPEWASGGEYRIHVNGASVPTKAGAGSYVDVTRTWNTGDVIEVALPMRLSTESAPGGNYAAFFYGPVLLAGALGDDGLTRDDFYGGGNNTNITNQLAVASQPLTNFPGLAMPADDAIGHFNRVPEKPLTFDTTKAMTESSVTLQPLYDVFFERYTVYWPTQTFYAPRDEDAQKLAERTVDHVIIGDASSEQSHHLTMDNSHTAFAGQGPYRAWRDASGWFGYNMRVQPDKPMTLRCAYWGSDGGRTFHILGDGEQIATVHLTASKPDNYIAEEYPIPSALTQGKKQIAIRFDAAGSTAGGIFDVRMLQA